MNRRHFIFWAIASAPLCWTQSRGVSWNKVRYRGGTVAAKVNPYDWNTTLTVSPDGIGFVFGSKPFRLRTSQVVSLSYGVEAHRKVARVVDAIAVALTLNPLGLFGLLKDRQDHLIGIVYQDDDGKQGAILLESDSYRSILLVLENSTGKRAEKSP